MPLVVTVLSGCGDDEPKDEVGIVMMSVSSEVTVINALGADALCPVECMLVRIEGEDGQCARCRWGLSSISTTSVATNMS